MYNLYVVFGWEEYNGIKSKEYNGEFGGKIWKKYTRKCNFLMISIMKTMDMVGN